MSESDDMIQAYIQKVLKIQQEQRLKPLDIEEMNKIARDLGMSETDMAFIQKKLQDYVARGKGYSRYEDWDSAIEEYLQAITLSPGHVDALYGLANAYKHRWLLRDDKEDLHQAKKYVKQALQVDANHDNSFRLASELNKGTSKSKYSRSNLWNDFKGLDTDLKDISNAGKDTFKDLMDSVDETFNNVKSQPSHKRLKKSTRDKKIFGVCAGIGEYMNIDATWIRIGFILGVLFGVGAPIPLYIVLAFILPKN